MCDGTFNAGFTTVLRPTLFNEARCNGRKMKTGEANSPNPEAIIQQGAPPC